jgi:hypothetical protein
MHQTWRGHSLALDRHLDQLGGQVPVLRRATQVMRDLPFALKRVPMAHALLRHLAVAVPLLAAPLTAQTSSVSGPPRELSGELVAELLQDMKASLRNLVTAQEMYFSDYNTYGKVLSRQDGGTVVIAPAAGVTLTLTYATASSWTGRATHDWLPGMSCVIFVGNVPASRQMRTTLQGLSPKTEASPVCDRP